MDIAPVQARLMIRLTQRQVAKLLHEVEAEGINPAYVVFEDGQSVGDLTRTVTGIEVDSEQSVGGVYRFRLSDYVSSGSRLVSRLKTAVEDAAWIIIHVGGTQCPPALLELMTYISAQDFQTPRFLVAVERLDLECASNELQELFKLEPIIDLTIDRDEAYFRELVAPLGAPTAATEALVRLHLRMLESAVPAYLQSLRTLARACEIAAIFDLRTAVDSNYLGGLTPSSADYAAVRQLIEEVIGDGAA